MGITFVNVKVTNPARPKKTGVHELLVDSGAIYSVLPASRTQDVGHQADPRKREFLLGHPAVWSP